MRRANGSFTIEAAIIVPVIMFIFVSLVHILFYWHDKNILMSTAHEAAALGSGRSDISELELEYEFFSRMEGRLLLFDRVECTSRIEEEKVTVEWHGSKRFMVAKGAYSICKTKPEHYIREVRKIKKLGEGLVDKE